MNNSKSLVTNKFHNFAKLNLSTSRRQINNKLLKEQISIVSKKEITHFIDIAQKISPDPKDTIYLALALALKSDIWSNDKSIKEDQKEITVFSTEELIEKTNLLKIKIILPKSLQAVGKGKHDGRR